MFSLSFSWAQTTFTVDMSTYTGPCDLNDPATVVHAFGEFTGWQIGPLPLTPIGGGIYTGTWPTTINGNDPSMDEYVFAVVTGDFACVHVEPDQGLSGDCTNGVNRTINGGTVDQPYGGCPPPPAAEVTISDPCSCSDPENVTATDGTVTHFHDVLSVTGAANAPVTLVTNGGGVYLSTGLSAVANGTVLGTTDAAGALAVDFFHASGATGTITVDIGGVVVDFTVAACEGDACVTIPTMSEWGLMIFLLLIMNMSLVFLRRLELVGLRMN